jgi:hypothetical protein
MNARRGRYGGQDQVTQSIWFDLQRRPATPELQAVITSLIASLEQREDALAPRLRARRETDRHSFHLAIECIACNLATLIVTASIGRSLFLSAVA